ncbi:AsmA-like C-terminal region [Tistlia consotensis]|uniref:AsmA-like C-terminal region n=1 Tax=Tistlia consotensis USBA 355 TaxID=560819 RepID=A0A1Y6B4G0_9PROT|nr:AsmA family protein [Tistlia consotensis]SME88888.1 AsmA-like C-terminal region [Tistlia consotensis USBA 355]SNR25434.1 AsmA-like C-terminal region [Tistlia consotensis]
MRTLLIVLGAILSLLVLAVLAGPMLVDWNAFKPRLAAAVEQATGRQLEITGDLSLSILPTPTLSAEGASLSNVAGGSEPTMVSLKTLEVQVALGPLVGGDLKIKSLVLVQPRILLERLADGRVNWDLAPPKAAPAAAPAATQAPAGQAGSTAPAQQPAAQQPAAPAASGGGGEPLSVSLQQVRIEDGTLVYRDAVAGREEKVEALNATLKADSLRGPFQIEGKAQARGTAASFTASTGQLALAGATPVTLTLTLPELGATEARFTGDLTAGEAPKAAGDLTVKGKNLLVLLDFAAPGSDLPGGLAQPFALSGRLAYGDDKLGLSAIDLSMADSAVGGKTSVTFGKPTDLEVALTVSRLDLDSLLADGGGGGQDPAPVPSFSLPAGLRASVDLQVDTLVWRREIVRQVLVNADLQDGRVALNQALALLPGGGNVVLSGNLTAEQHQPHFVGRLEATADNLRAIMGWLGVDAGAVPSDRLRRASLLANVDGTPQQASITGIDLEIDASRVTGGVALALRDRLGVGLGLTVDRINLDAYLPGGGPEAEAAQPAGKPKPAAQAQTQAQTQVQPEAKAGAGKAAEDQGQAAGQAVGQAAGQAGSPQQPAAATAPKGGVAGLLRAVDANIDLTLGQVTYNGQSARQVTLDGTLQQGRLTLRRLTVGDLAGGAFSLSGVFSGLPDAPSVEDGSFDISVTDTGRLSRLLGQPADGVLAQLGSFRASGSASGSAKGFSYNADVTALGGSIFSSGKVAGLPDQLKISDARLQASGVKGPALAKVAGLPADSPLARLDTVDLTSQFDYSAAEAHYDTRLKTLGAEFDAQGKAGDFASGLPSFDFRFAAIKDDFPALLRHLLGQSPLAPNAGKLDLRAQISGNPLQIKIADLKGDVGPTIESGTIEVALARARPFVKADLKTREIDLGRLFGDGGGGGADPAPRWSRQPIELGALRQVDAEFALDAKALRQGKLVLAPAALRGKLDGGVLTIDRLAGTFYDGRLEASGKLDASGDLAAATLAAKLAGADVGAFLHDQGSDRAKGRVDLDAELASRGNSPAALVTALGGQGKVGGELTIDVKAREEAGNVLLGILGKQVKELRGVTNPLNELFGAFAGQPGKLSGTIQVEGGVATTRDLQLAGNGARLESRGTLANLPAWTLSLNNALYKEGISDPQVEIDLTGALDQPNVRLKGTGLQITPGKSAPPAANPLEQLLQKALPGAQQQLQQPSDQLQITPDSQTDSQSDSQSQQQSSPPKPADILRGLIQGLGKKSN